MSAETAVGNYNTIVGYNSGRDVGAGAESNIILGSLIELPSNTDDGQLTIGNLIFGDGIDGADTTASSGSIGIGAMPATNMSQGDLMVEGGALALKERTTPTADADYGKVYTKSDNKLYFQDGGGTEHEIAFV